MRCTYCGHESSYVAWDEVWARNACTNVQACELRLRERRPKAPAASAWKRALAFVASIWR